MPPAASIPDELNKALLTQVTSSPKKHNHKTYNNNKNEQHTPTKPDGPKKGITIHHGSTMEHGLLATTETSHSAKLKDAFNTPIYSALYNTALKDLKDAFFSTPSSDLHNALNASLVKQLNNPDALYNTLKCTIF